MRRVPRIVLTGAAAVLAVAGLAGCRTSPNVAAYVGDDQITVAELQTAIDERLQDDDVAAFADTDPDAFARQVLGLLVGEDVYAAAAERWDVTVTDDEVRDRIDTLLAGNDPDAVYAQLAAQGVSREDVFENVRQQLVRQKIAAAEGLDDPLSDAALRQQYDQNLAQYTQYSVGFIAVPDQATADAVVGQLTADPASYAAAAAAFPGQITLPQPEPRSADQIPSVVADQVRAAQPGTAFSVPVEGAGVVVTFVADVTVRPFEDVRPDLQAAAESTVDDQAQQLVQDFRDDLDVRVNPRYGVLQENAVVEGEDGVVEILDDDSGAGGAPATPSGTTGG
ncbi:peptidylprolyl isomerase [Geodermatophilus sp. URMC 64]